MRREPIFNIPAAVLAVLLALVGLHAVREWLLSAEADRILVWSLAFVPARYDGGALIDGVLPGGRLASVLSFFTYALLHADWTHVGFNTLWLLASASPVARRFGSLRFLAFLTVSVMAGALAYLIALAGALSPMIGASAGVSGMMGAAVRFAFEPGGSLDLWSRDRQDPDRVPAATLMGALRNPRAITFVGVWLGLNLLFGLVSIQFFVAEGQSVAWEAHLGGFLAGLALFQLFDPVRTDEVLVDD